MKIPHQVIAESFDINSIRDPVAFISNDSTQPQKSGFSRVVIFTELGAGHFGGNPVFHAFQVRKRFLCKSKFDIPFHPSFESGISRKALGLFYGFSASTTTPRTLCR